VVTSQKNCDFDFLRLHHKLALIQIVLGGHVIHHSPYCHYFLCDLTGEQIAQAYKLRWNIENFFAWWKRHLKVYHLMARSAYGLMVQILAGLITYLLLAIHCHKQFQEKVSIRRVRQLRTAIENELRSLPDDDVGPEYVKEQNYNLLMQKPNRKLLNPLPPPFFQPPGRAP
jgi:hypothetical protein